MSDEKKTMVLLSDRDIGRLRRLQMRVSGLLAVVPSEELEEEIEVLHGITWESFRFASAEEAERFSARNR